MPRYYELSCGRVVEVSRDSITATFYPNGCEIPAEPGEIEEASGWMERLCEEINECPGPRVIVNRQRLISLLEEIHTDDVALQTLFRDGLNAGVLHIKLQGRAGDVLLSGMTDTPEFNLWGYGARPGEGLRRRSQIRSGRVRGVEHVTRIKVRPRGRRGQPTITQEQLEGMVAMHQEGWGWGTIGKKYGFSGTHISKRVRAYLAKE